MATFIFKVLEVNFAEFRLQLVFVSRKTFSVIDCFLFLDKNEPQYKWESDGVITQVLPY